MKFTTFFCLLLICTSSFGRMIVKNNQENEVMRVTEDGQVGIGTTAPTQVLDINGTPV